MKASRLFHIQAGYTLTEVVVVVSLMAMMSVVGFSSFSTYQKKERVRSVAYQFASDLKEARMRAIEKHVSHTVAMDATSYTVYMDTNSDCVLDDGENIVKQVTVTDQDPGITIGVPSSFSLRFDVRGMVWSATGSFGNSTITFANEQGVSWNVVLSSLGSVSVNENTGD